MTTDKKTQLVDLVRSLMYGTSDMLQEAHAIAVLLADIDGVSIDDDCNRLLLSLDELKNSDPLSRAAAAYSIINQINDQ
jgi:hypothetical protein